MTLSIHENIKEKLHYYISKNKRPNIIFHGSSGCGKRKVLYDFINDIYSNDIEKIRSFVMNVNCAHGKGIKFIREELKFFAKTHIYSNGGDIFKSIILLNADKLTIDAQSALRRCIELFSHNTRFFIVVEDKYKLLKPILSRFCEIYIPEPIHNGLPINLYKHNTSSCFKIQDENPQRMEWLKKELKKIECMSMVHESASANKNNIDLLSVSVKLYERGYCGLDIIQLLENNAFCDFLKVDKRYELLFTFNKIRKEFRNEKMLMLFMLHFLYINNTVQLENISFAH